MYGEYYALILLYKYLWHMILRVRIRGIIFRLNHIIWIWGCHNISIRNDKSTHNSICSFDTLKGVICTTYIKFLREERIEERFVCYCILKGNLPFISGWSVYFFWSYESTIDGFAAFDYQTTGFHAISV